MNQHKISFFINPHHNKVRRNGGKRDGKGAPGRSFRIVAAGAEWHYAELRLRLLSCHPAGQSPEDGGCAGECVPGLPGKQPQPFQARPELGEALGLNQAICHRAQGRAAYPCGKLGELR